MHCVTDLSPSAHTSSSPSSPGHDDGPNQLPGRLGVEVPPGTLVDLVHHLQDGDGAEHLVRDLSTQHHVALIREDGSDEPRPDLHPTPMRKNADSPESSLDQQTTLTCAGGLRLTALGCSSGDRSPASPASPAPCVCV